MNAEIFLGDRKDDEVTELEDSDELEDRDELEEMFKLEGQVNNSVDLVTVDRVWLLSVSILQIN